MTSMDGNYTHQAKQVLPGLLSSFSLGGGRVDQYPFFPEADRSKSEHLPHHRCWAAQGVTNSVIAININHWCSVARK